MSTAAAIAAFDSPPFWWVADCLVCEPLGEPTTQRGAWQAAAEHADDHHDGEAHHHCPPGLRTRSQR